MCFYSYKFQNNGTYVKATQYSSMEPPSLSRLLYKQTECSHLLPGQQVLNTYLKT